MVKIPSTSAPPREAWAPEGDLEDASATVELSVDVGGLAAPAPTTLGIADSLGADLAPGAQIGEYVVHAQIARGGFGTVYRADHAVTGAPRALKVLHAELAATREAILRFEREVAAIRRVSHPNVIAIEGVGRIDDGRPYFAMDLLVGVDLDAHLAAVGRLSPREALAILAPLAEALGAVHAAGIVHRDLKPSNVFLSDEAGGRRVVLLDFSIAKILDDRGPGLTSSRRVLGTPAFMAPEQIQGRPADERADVYALGAVLFCMLTGGPPFLATRDLLPQLVLHAKPPRPSSLAPLDPALDAVILGALSKDPDNRPPTPGALLDAIRLAIGAAAPAEMARRAAAIYVEVRVEGDAEASPDDHLRADFDAILPRAAALLGPRGLRPALEMGNTAIFLRDLPGGAAEDLAARAEVLRAALALHRDLDRRPDRDDRVRVSLCLHAGPVSIDPRGALGGALLDVDAWVPDPPPVGVIATDALLAGVDHEGPLAEGALVRVGDPDAA